MVCRFDYISETDLRFHDVDSIWTYYSVSRRFCIKNPTEHVRNLFMLVIKISLSVFINYKTVTIKKIYIYI